MRQEKTEGKQGGAEKPRGEKWSLGNEEKAIKGQKGETLPLLHHSPKDSKHS